ncbi:MAG: hypothetical protein ACI4U2_02845 [Christensenellaceae bacterium]
MSNCQYQTYPCIRTVATLSAQTAVECKLSGVDFAAPLSLRATVVPTSGEVLSGEFRYGGRVVFSVVYLDGSNQVCRLERGAEFMHSVEDDALAPAQTAQIRFLPVKVTLRRENGTVFLTAMIPSEILLTVSAERSILMQTDLIAKKTELVLPRMIVAHGSSEAEDEFETEYLNDVLTHSECVLVEKTSCGGGFIRVEGEIALLVTALTEKGLVNYERLVPFSAELPADDVSVGLPASAEVFIRSVSLHADSDEEKGSCRILTEFTLDYTCRAWSEQTVSAVSDAFSPAVEVNLVRERLEEKIPSEAYFVTERIAGTCVTDAMTDFSTSVRALTDSRVTASVENGKIEGVVSVNAILEDKEGVLKRAELDVPFTVPAKGEGRVNCLVCGLKITQRREGELEAEGTVKAYIAGEKTVSAEYVASEEDGKPIPPETSSVSVFFPQPGDDLWTTAKKLLKSPEELLACNDGLSFPLTGKERIVVRYAKRN